MRLSGKCFDIEEKIKMIPRRKYFSIGLIALSLVSGSAFAVDAKAQLIAMAKKLAEAKQFSFSMHMSYDVVQKSGQMIQFNEVRKVQISRPNHLRVDAWQSDGDTGGLLFDGKNITLFNRAENVYSQTSRPGDVDAAVRYAVGKLKIRVPLARMLVTSLPKELQRLSGEVDYIERDMFGATPTDHIAGRTDGVDYQFWITKDKLPTRIVLTYKDAPGQPQFQAEFSDWNFAPEVNASTFAFTPQEGAEKIPTLIPVAQTNVDDSAKGGPR